MPVEIRLPAVAPSVAEVTFVRWLKKVGDSVQVGEVFAEVETDKALVDLEATDPGIIGKLYVDDGTAGVKVGSLIGMLVQAGESLAEPRPGVQEPAPPARREEVQARGDRAAAIVENRQAGDRIFASPLARRLVREANLDLSKIHGTGPNGRILKRDVEAAEKANPLSSAKTSPSTQSSAAPVAEVGQYEEIPHSSMRRVIAQRLTESKQHVPHFYLRVDCALDALLAIRAQINEAGVTQTKISINDFIIRAVALALRKVPAANASWTDAAIHRYHDVDIAVAVATPNGLVTPIIRRADQKSLANISVEMRALSERARAGRLLPDEYQGGGFTISNLGMYGIKEFAAIINPPQACILAVGAAEQRPMVKHGELIAATISSFTLSVDHRAVDGAVAAEFLAALKSGVENPLTILV
jgi:pyruvate dehydrogenase E2 component (dihydrolipoamide acetyltransferase)